MKIGVHCSIKNGYIGALKEAKQLGCNCLQMFTHSPRMWNFKSPSQQEVNEFKQLRKKLKLYPLVIHTAYLPNPASSDNILYKKTKDLLLLEFELSNLFEADYLVMHPGSYSANASLEEGVKNIVDSIDFCFKNILKKDKTIKFTLLLENVCGSGRKIGRTFEELSKIINKSEFKEKIGICIDTAHSFAFGYKIHTEEGIKVILEEIRNFLGIEKLKLIHLNDSKQPLGSKIDQHQHITKGFISEKGILNIIKWFKKLPFILETPKETPFDKISKKDKENLKILKLLFKKAAI
ncbi:MAG: deoxyribonuclease IV [Endomicrobia bacterium]|nr:deoxyribonuclease IV [Endomicrobiia bacterium]